MAEIKLAAATGRTLGTRPSRRLRAEGKIPATVYGLGADPVSVTVDWRPLREALTTEAGLNALINLTVGETTELVIVKEMQRHPIRGDVLHLDFLRVDADELISIDVPVVLEGEAIEVERADGTVDQTLFALTVWAKPNNIPNELTVDISGLVLGESIRVGDLTLPEGVTTDIDSEESVVSALAGVVIEEEPAEGEAAEGEAAPAADGDAED